MERKSIGLSGDELAALTDDEAAIAARSVSGVVSNLVGAQYDPAMAGLSAGETDEERYVYVGLEWLEFIIRYGRLSRDGSVLDIGCGAGRIAEPLSFYLGRRGRYRGFDVTAKQINRCRDLITHPRFQFDVIDLNHAIYNPQGRIKPEEFRFLFDDNSFDVVFAASIFSHLRLAVAKSYLSEIARVLRPNGRAILSFFAIPQEEKRAVGAVTSKLGRGDGEYAYRFLSVGNGFYVHCDDAGLPKSHYVNDASGDPVAFDADALIGLAHERGLACLHFLEGAWRFTRYVHGWQDIVVLRKRQVASTGV